MRTADLQQRAECHDKRTFTVEQSHHNPSSHVLSTARRQNIVYVRLLIDNQQDT